MGQFSVTINSASLYTLTFVVAMNQAKYDALSDDLKAVIDANSGLNFSVFGGGTQADADGPARQIAVENGNEITTIADVQPWLDIVQPVYADWVSDMNEKGIDGQALIDQARGLMSGECKGANATF